MYLPQQQSEPIVTDIEDHRNTTMHDEGPRFGSGRDPLDDLAHKYDDYRGNPLDAPGSSEFKRPANLPPRVDGPTMPPVRASTPPKPEDELRTTYARPYTPPTVGSVPARRPSEEKPSTPPRQDARPSYLKELEPEPRQPSYSSPERDAPSYRTAQPPYAEPLSRDALRESDKLPPVAVDTWSPREIQPDPLDKVEHREYPVSRFVPTVPAGGPPGMAEPGRIAEPAPVEYVSPSRQPEHSPPPAQYKSPATLLAEQPAYMQPSLSPKESSPLPPQMPPPSTTAGGPVATGKFNQAPKTARIVRDEEARDSERNCCRKCYQKMGQCPQYCLKFLILTVILVGWICGGGFALREIEMDAWDERTKAMTQQIATLNLTPDQFNGLLDLGCVNQFKVNPWKLESSWLFCLTTITTIGWGGQAPATWGGRLFTTFYATFGIFISILCYAQAGVLLVQMVHLAHRGICASKYHVDGKGKLKNRGMKEVAELFAASDRDKSGQLDSYELQGMLSRLGGQWVTPDELDDIMEAADMDGSGFISEQEFSIAAAVYLSKKESERAVLPVCVSTFIFLCLIFFGGWFWQWRESNWTYWEGCWFMFTTLVTLGYGDFRPDLSDDWNIRYAGIWIFVGISLVSMMIVSYIKLLTPKINKLRRAFHRTTADAADWAALGRRKKAEAKMQENKRRQHSSV